MHMSGAHTCKRKQCVRGNITMSVVDALWHTGEIKEHLHCTRSGGAGIWGCHKDAEGARGGGAEGGGKVGRDARNLASNLVAMLLTATMRNACISQIAVTLYHEALDQGRQLLLQI